MTDEREENGSSPIDFSAVDPLKEPEHFEQLVGRIRHAAVAELVRRQGRLTLWGELAAWRRTILATSCGLAIASMLVLALVSPSTTARRSIAESIGIPQGWVQWVERGENPGPGDLLRLERSEP